jgi:hypothetical protein
LRSQLSNGQLPATYHEQAAELPYRCCPNDINRCRRVTDKQAVQGYTFFFIALRWASEACGFFWHCSSFPLIALGGMDAAVTMLYWSFFAEKTPKLKKCQGRHFFNIIL